MEDRGSRHSTSQGVISAFSSNLHLPTSILDPRPSILHLYPPSWNSSTHRSKVDRPRYSSAGYLFSLRAILSLIASLKSRFNALLSDKRQPATSAISSATARRFSGS